MSNNIANQKTRNYESTANVAGEASLPELVNLTNSIQSEIRRTEELRISLDSVINKISPIIREPEKSEDSGNLKDREYAHSEILNMMYNHLFYENGKLAQLLQHLNRVAGY